MIEQCQHKKIKHQVEEPELGYVAWFDWCDKQLKMKHSQVLCGDCKHYVWVYKKKKEGNSYKIVEV